MKLDPERERKALVVQPESLCVGDLNQAVKDLRELLYQKQLRIQELEEELETAKYRIQELQE